MLREVIKIILLGEIEADEPPVICYFLIFSLLTTLLLLSYGKGPCILFVIPLLFSLSSSGPMNKPLQQWTSDPNFLFQFRIFSLAWMPCTPNAMFNFASYCCSIFMATTVVSSYLVSYILSDVLRILISSMVVKLYFQIGILFLATQNWINQFSNQIMATFCQDNICQCIQYDICTS